MNVKQMFWHNHIIFYRYAHYVISFRQNEKTQISQNENAFGFFFFQPHYLKVSNHDSYQPMLVEV